MGGGTGRRRPGARRGRAARAAPARVARLRARAPATRPLVDPRRPPALDAHRARTPAPPRLGGGHRGVRRRPDRRRRLRDRGRAGRLGRRGRCARGGSPPLHRRRHRLPRLRACAAHRAAASDDRRRRRRARPRAELVRRRVDLGPRRATGLAHGNAPSGRRAPRGPRARIATSRLPQRGAAARLPGAEPHARRVPPARRRRPSLHRRRRHLPGQPFAALLRAPAGERLRGLPPAAPRQPPRPSPLTSGRTRGPPASRSFPLHRSGWC